jgi:hypothetical protein
MPASQFPADDLTDSATQGEAASLVMDLTGGLPAEVRLTPLLMALANTFKNLCEDRDLDPEAAFTEIVDALSSADIDQPALPFLN